MKPWSYSLMFELLACLEILSKFSTPPRLLLLLRLSHHPQKPEHNVRVNLISEILALLKAVHTGHFSAIFFFLADAKD